MMHLVASGAAYAKPLGWGASVVLVMTISTQIYRQWKSGTSKGVSIWLFVGQIIASSGFSVYSYLVHDIVFIFTNLVMLLAAFFGLTLVFWHHRKNGDEGEG